MKLSDLIELSKEYDSLGDTEQAIVDKLVAGVSLDQLSKDEQYYLYRVRNFLDFLSGYGVEGAYDLWVQVVEFESLDSEEGGR